jgi:hypothetical protein
MTILLCGVLLLLLLTPVAGKSTQSSLPICESLPEQGPDDTVSLFTAQETGRSGVVCVRVYNGMYEVIRYEGSALQLERRWFGLVWLPLTQMRLGDVFRGCKPGFLLGIERVVLPGTLSDSYLPSIYEPASSGTYRVHLRYRLPEQDIEQSVYSEEFIVP